MKSSVLTNFEFAPFDIIDGDRGKNYPKQNEFASEGHCLFLSATNVTKSGFDFSDCQFISEQKDGALRKGKLCRGDVILTTRGTIGNSAYYSDAIQYDHMRINSGMVILRCKTENILPVYLYHFLRSPSFYGQVNSLRSGVAQPQLPIRDIKRIKLPLPSIKVQSRISSFLSAYDDLIENNRSRIQLLEKAARLLYKEWFVHLRFPGHEHVKIKDGVPDGWKKMTLRDLSVSVNYGYTTSAKKEKVGPKFLRITDIVPDVIDWHSVPYCEITEKELAKFSLREGDVVVARTGATVGYAKRIASIQYPTVFASYLVRFRFNEEIDDLITGIFMESDEFKSFVLGNAGGAAQPNANAKVLSSATILKPAKYIQVAFREFTQPLFHQKESLQYQNQVLRQARDILLPRLMNGEVSF